MRSTALPRIGLHGNFSPEKHLKTGFTYGYYFSHIINKLLIFRTSGFASKITSMMAQGIVLTRKPGYTHYIHHEHIAYHSHHGSGSSRRKAKRTHLGRGSVASVTSAIADNSLSGLPVMTINGLMRTKVMCKMHKVYDFTGLARIGYQQHHIIGLKHAQVAVLGLGRMQIHGRNTG